MVHLRGANFIVPTGSTRMVVDSDFDRGEAVKASFPTLAAEMGKLTGEPCDQQAT